MAERSATVTMRSPGGRKARTAAMRVVLPAPPGTAPVRNGAPPRTAWKQRAAISAVRVPASMRSTMLSARPPRWLRRSIWR